ncbi:hypothetical protein [Pasteuria penetrans]|uniref:hypothetical protein n=1 Tax=Pasteuria penetrans TaxID=86005 RepID=UPI000FAF1D09|nr:hypothetical protein [Pasteuria penetrans]
MKKKFKNKGIAIGVTLLGVLSISPIGVSTDVFAGGAGGGLLGNVVNGTGGLLGNLFNGILGHGGGILSGILRGIGGLLGIGGG